MGILSFNDLLDKNHIGQEYKDYNNNNREKLRQASLRRRPTRRSPMVAHCAVQRKNYGINIICTIFGVDYIQFKRREYWSRIHGLHLIKK